MPRYEYSSGSSNKFWEIVVEGSRYTVHYGRIGTAGQTSVKSFTDAATAQKKADAAARSKVKKGYVLLDEAEVAAQDSETAQLLVLADQLQEQGDPRGELISLMHRMEQASGAERKALTAQRAVLRAAHTEAFDGPRTDPAKAACTSVEWRLGYWDRLTLISHYDHQEVVTEQLLSEMLAHPSSTRLRYLKLGIPHSVWGGGTTWQPVLDALGEADTAHLEELEIADDDDNAEISWCDIGSLAEVWKAAPNLERLRVRGGQIGLGAIVAPKLERLEIISGGLPKEPVVQLGKATLPALTHLEVYLGTEEYGASTTLDDCAGILSGRGLPKLTTLGLKNGEIMDELATKLVGAPILSQLEVLDLSMGTMTDEGAKALIEHAAAFAHLSRLDVSENYLTSGVASRLRAALPNASTHGQKDAFEDGDDEPYYYTSIAE